MKNNIKNPLDVARELGYSIIESNEFYLLKKAEEKLFNDEKAFKLINEINGLKNQYDNERQTPGIKVDEIDLKIERVQSQIDSNIIIQEYLNAKKNYEKLISNIYNVLEYFLGEYNINNRCSRKCNSDCSNCKK